MSKEKDNVALTGGTQSIEQVAKNIRVILEEISHGNSNTIDIQKSLDSKGIIWSYNKIQRYMTAAYEMMNRENNLKQLMDQRYILIKMAESVAASEWFVISNLEKLRQQALMELDNGKDFDELSFEHREILGTDIGKYHSTISNCKKVVLSAISQISELHGFKTDKTVLIKAEKGQKLRYMDDVNEELRKKYRNNFDGVTSEEEDPDEIVVSEDEAYINQTKDIPDDAINYETQVAERLLKSIDDE